MGKHITNIVRSCEQRTRQLPKYCKHWPVWWWFKRDFRRIWLLEKIFNGVQWNKKTIL